MNIEELEKRLRALSIQPHAYSLNGKEKDEATVLAQDGDRWLVYYSERGQRNNVQSFRSIDEACEAVLRTLSRDPSTRVPLTNFADDPPFRPDGPFTRLTRWLRAILNP